MKKFANVLKEILKWVTIVADLLSNLFDHIKPDVENKK